MEEVACCTVCKASNSTTSAKFCEHCGASLPEYMGRFAPTATYPYGSRRTRWLRPVLVAGLLVAFDDTAVLSGFAAAFLVLVYLPMSFMRERYPRARKERMVRFAIYCSAVVAVFALNAINSHLAEARAERIIAAVEQYKTDNGGFPDKLYVLIPKYLPEIPNRANDSYSDIGFRYRAERDGHELMYVEIPPSSAVSIPLKSANGSPWTDFARDVELTS